MNLHCLQGGDCFNAFMQSGLHRQILKAVWAVVAGDASFLTQDQFVSCLYLMDLAKQGRPLPSSIPSGTFPPRSQPEVSGKPVFDLNSVQQVIFRDPDS